MDGWMCMNPGCFLLQELGECGKAPFYEGRVAAAIVDVIRENGGVMTLEDLKSHNSEVISPIGTRYKVSVSRVLLCYCLCNMAVCRVNEHIVCPGRDSVGTAPKWSGVGRSAAAQYPGQLPPQR